MPYKSERIKLQGLQDRRRKLTDEDYILIKEMYATGDWSSRKLGKEFGVSHHTILMIVSPVVSERVKRYNKEHWREYQQTREDATKAMRETRRYKQSLYLKGELKEKEC